MNYIQIYGNFPLICGVPVARLVSRLFFWRPLKDVEKIIPLILLYSIGHFAVILAIKPSFPSSQGLFEKGSCAVRLN